MTNADFEEIYKKYRGFSKWLAGQLVHNSAIAEDISQEAFASIYNMSEELDLSNERKTGGLVKTVTFNKVRDYFKSPQRQFENNTVEITDEENLRNLSYEIDDLLLGMEAKKNMKFVFQKLREENEMNYEIFVRVKFYGISPASVAREFHITTNNVNNRILRTKRWLLDEYQKISK